MAYKPVAISALPRVTSLEEDDVIPFSSTVDQKTRGIRLTDLFGSFFLGSPLDWGNITGTPTTLAGYGITGVVDAPGGFGKRVASVASGATITPNADTQDQLNVLALAVDATIAAPAGTPRDGQIFRLRIKDNGAPRALTYNAIYRAFGVVFPPVTIPGKTAYIGLEYNAADNRWDVLGVARES